MLPSLVLRTFAETSYLFLVLLLIVATGLSCAALLAQAVRTSPSQSWVGNVNALVIGASYLLVLILSFLYCGKRRIAVGLRLQRITTKPNRALGRKDVPDSVHKHITQEYVRTCLIAYESLPTDAHHEGWGKPGTQYSGIRFRRALLDTVTEIDNLARSIIPSHPPSRPHARMLQRFRFLIPLLSVDEDGLTPLHYYDSAVQIARNGNAELSEHEFTVGIQAARDIEQCLDACRSEMLEGSSTQVDL